MTDPLDNRVGRIRGPSGATLDTIVQAIVANGAKLDTIVQAIATTNVRLSDIASALQVLITQTSVGNNAIVTALGLNRTELEDTLRQALFTFPDSGTGISVPYLLLTNSTLGSVSDNTARAADCCEEGTTEPVPTLGCANNPDYTLVGAMTDWAYVGSEFLNGELVYIWRPSINGMTPGPSSIVEFRINNGPPNWYSPRVLPERSRICIQWAWAQDNPQAAIDFVELRRPFGVFDTGQEGDVGTGGSVVTGVTGASGVYQFVIDGEDVIDGLRQVTALNFVFRFAPEQTPPTATIAMYEIQALS